jgi:hypothetical protein
MVPIRLTAQDLCALLAAAQSLHARGALPRDGYWPEEVSLDDLRETLRMGTSLLVQLGAAARRAGEEVVLGLLEAKEGVAVPGALFSLPGVLLTRAQTVAKRSRRRKPLPRHAAFRRQRAVKAGKLNLVVRRRNLVALRKRHRQLLHAAGA